MIIDVLDGGPEPLVVVIDGDGAVVASGFGPAERILGMARLDDQPVPGEARAIRTIWADYLSGDLSALDAVPVRQEGSPVQVAVWDALREIPAGHPISYAEMADVIGRPRAARAVGGACGANHVAPFVPCHRVIASGGGLGGYGYGLPVKQWLLDHEAHHCRRPSGGMGSAGPEA